MKRIRLMVEKGDKERGVTSRPDFVACRWRRLCASAWDTTSSEAPPPNTMLARLLVRGRGDTLRGFRGGKPSAAPRAGRGDVPERMARCRGTARGDSSGEGPKAAKPLNGEVRGLSAESCMP